jgi:glycosyltransferase involved in cell wall biosynthesis
MRVLLFGQHFSEYVVNVLSGFDQSIDIELIISKENIEAEISTECVPRSTAIHLVSMPGPKHAMQFVHSLRAVHQLLRQIRPDVVHFQEMPKGFTFLCWLLAKPALRVLTIHDITSHPGQDSKTSSRHEYIKQTMRRTADALIVHGDALAQQLALLDPALTRKAHIVPHPAMRTVPSLTFRPPTHNRLLFFGRIAKYKGLTCLLQACLKLQERRIPFTLVIAGQGDDFAANEALLQQIACKEIVHRRIAPDEIDRLFENADIVVLPYIEASQSGVAAYAMGFGKPCVATNTGSLPEVVQDGINGLICPAGDADALANRLETLLANPQLIQLYGANAYAMASGIFSSVSVAQKTLAVYSATVRNGLAPIEQPR